MAHGCWRGPNYSCVHAPPPPPPGSWDSLWWEGGSASLGWRGESPGGLRGSVEGGRFIGKLLTVGWPLCFCFCALWRRSRWALGQPEGRDSVGFGPGTAFRKGNVNALPLFPQLSLTPPCSLSWTPREWPVIQAQGPGREHLGLGGGGEGLRVSALLPPPPPRPHLTLRSPFSLSLWL